MPFDAYSGTLSQYVDRVVNLLTSLPSSPFEVVATWGTTYRWYALQYTDPDDYANNVYLIIGPTAFRTTTRTAYSSTEYANWSYCITGSYGRGRPGNVHGIFVGVASQFDPTNFAVPTTATMRATFGLRAYDIVVTYDVSPTACNDTTIPYRYVDLQSTLYTWYDEYGFTFIQIPQQTVYRDVGFVMHVQRITPFNTNITGHWWVLFTDQMALQTRSDTYSISINRFPPYPTNLCGRLTYTTSATGFGICMNDPTTLNMPPGISSYLVATSTYVNTFATSFTRLTKSCPFSTTERAPVSFYASTVRHMYTPSYSIILPYFPLIMPPTQWLDDMVYAFRPLVVLPVGDVYPWAMRGIFGRITTLLPLAYSDSGISTGDIIMLDDAQYIAVQLVNIEQSYTVDLCYGGDTNSPPDTVNTDVMFYALRYA